MKRSEKNNLRHPGPAHAMANPWPRETFVIPGDAGQVARTINMIKVDDTFRTQLLTIFNGATSDQGPNVGGPCGGKSSGLKIVAAHLRRLGWTRVTREWIQLTRGAPLLTTQGLVSVTL
eukprot:COSAG05_NODE_446_length_9772_cov_117.012923_6_plen_119_part_00